MAKYDVPEGQYDVGEASFAIVVTRWNHAIVSKLCAGAVDAFARHGVGEERLSIVTVPGAYEIPVAAQKLASSGQFAAIVTLGAVIRGGTPHFEYVAGQCADGVSRVALDHGLPVIFGVLTVNDLEQAEERAGGSEGNKGEEAALAALEMAALFRQLPG